LSTPQDSLTRAVQPLTRAVYEQGPPPGGNGAPSQGAGGDVVDAEFKDVSDQKD
jgi:hypothetical protein